MGDFLRIGNNMLEVCRQFHDSKQIALNPSKVPSRPWVRFTALRDSTSLAFPVRVHPDMGQRFTRPMLMQETFRLLGTKDDWHERALALWRSSVSADSAEGLRIANRTYGGCYLRPLDHLPQLE